MPDPNRQVVFIQNAIPPMRAGTYLLSARQSIPLSPEPANFPAGGTFVVAGERFTIQPAEIASVFPPALANGAFEGVFAHVIFNRRTLPWERQIDTPGSANHYPDAPWLAVLTCDESEAPPLQSLMAKDLVPKGVQITITDSDLTGTGDLDPSILSYGTAVLGQLEIGESPSDPCSAADFPVELFHKIAPAAADLEFLAHIREVDTVEGPDSDSAIAQNSVVISNRVPVPAGTIRAYLVSLEGMADYLPSADGAPSSLIGAGIGHVRLIVYRSWTFTTNDLNQTLEKLLSNLNDGLGHISTLSLPIVGNPPSANEVARAMSSQAAGILSSDDAAVLARNALLMGYAPMNHHLRHGGHTVSFYRSPLAPLPIPSLGAKYYSGPDAANRYNPETGLFDTSYGAAWQLGYLLALQSSGMSNQLYQWKRSVKMQQAIAAEQALLTSRLQGAAVLPTFLEPRSAKASIPIADLPEDVIAWFHNLATLEGVPFHYLVPDERMLPPESIRFFWLDQNWLDALIDGAFSIGRAAVSPSEIEPEHALVTRRLARAGAGRGFLNRRAAATAAPPGAADTVTGFVLRSQAVSGWPNLRILGFSDAEATTRIDTLRLARLSSDTLICLFNGVAASVLLREPPEQLHHGIEGQPGTYHVTLRSVSGGPGQVAPGEQYTSSPIPRKTPCDPDGSHPRVCVPLRADGRAVKIASAAAAARDRLTTDFGQSFPNGFTSAEFALEFTEGVVEVKFQQ